MGWDSESVIPSSLDTCICALMGGWPCSLLLPRAYLGWSSPGYITKFKLKWDPENGSSPNRGPLRGFLMCPVMYHLVPHIESVLSQSVVALARMQLTIGWPICELQRYREVSPGLLFHLSFFINSEWVKSYLKFRKIK